MRKILLGLLILPCIAVAADNSVTLSYSDTSGNTDTQTLSLSYDFSGNWNRWRASSTGDYLYKKSDGEETANKLSLKGRLERFITSRATIFVSSFLFSDRFSGYDYRVGIGPGVGYTLVKRDTEEVRCFVGLEYTYNNYSGGVSDSYMQGELAVELTKGLSDRLKLKSRMSYQVSLKDVDDYFIRFKSTLSVPILEKIAFEMSYRVDYQNLLPEGTEHHTDKTLLLGVSYSF